MNILQILGARRVTKQVSNWRLSSGVIFEPYCILKPPTWRYVKRYTILYVRESAEIMLQMLGATIQMLGATIQNLIAPAVRRPKFLYPCWNYFAN